MKIPTYNEALSRHKTPLDIFVSLWEPIHKDAKKAFRRDLAALIAYVEEAKDKELISLQKLNSFFGTDESETK